MKKYFLSILTISTTILYSQEVFRNKETGKEVIFLGSYKDDECLKVYDSGEIYFIEKDKLEKINELKPIELIDLISKNKLHFSFEGSEPFWSVKLNNNQIKFHENHNIETSIKIIPDKQSGFNFMFYSNDNKVFGLVKRTDYHFDKSNSCSLTNTEIYFVYEIYLTVNGKMYKGCGQIDI